MATWTNEGNGVRRLSGNLAKPPVPTRPANKKLKVNSSDGSENWLWRKQGKRQESCRISASVWGEEYETARFCMDHDACCIYADQHCRHYRCKTFQRYHHLMAELLLGFQYTFLIVVPGKSNNGQVCKYSFFPSRIDILIQILDEIVLAPFRLTHSSGGC